jgi:hypothetical protein
MSYLEHEEGIDGCGCSSCDLFDAYRKAITEYKTRKPYISFKMCDGGDFDLDAELNTLQSTGYELAYVIPGHRAHNRVVVMRSVPPLAPVAADVVTEMERRASESKAPGIAAQKDVDDFGPTMGGLQ